MSKMCVLEDKSCIDCGDCLYCDLDNTKLCDNCCQCLGDMDYRGIEIDDILLNEEKAESTKTRKIKYKSK